MGAAGRRTRKVTGPTGTRSGGSGRGGVARCRQLEGLSAKVQRQTMGPWWRCRSRQLSGPQGGFYTNFERWWASRGACCLVGLFRFFVPVLLCPCLVLVLAIPVRHQHARSHARTGPHTPWHAALTLVRLQRRQFNSGRPGSLYNIR